MRQALEQFQRALRIDPHNAVAQAGAGVAAFETGDYVLAQRYLHQGAENVESVQQYRQVADEVVSRDPGAARIGVQERRRRLDVDLAYAQQRLAECVGQRAADVSADEHMLHDELLAFGRRLRRSVPIDQDTVEAGLDLIERAESTAVKSCGPATPVDQALLLIARQYGARTP